ncbi:olfactory receptor 52D1-like [Tachyglossus aculeatus]|uniref:olfactory receptor 52D1-like n=1 Tax=Tachyglossus aculeatus TaxID=9261 RepID=UPI0018F55812|nr:olfactory receptor 52D1-like [Tachyglossus aculeatus]
MLISNTTSFHPSMFPLLGIPGMEDQHIWISLPFCSMYITALLGNGTILLVVASDKTLHKPMYLFLCILSLTDLVLCSTTLPKMLAIFWFGAQHISYYPCLTQMFFVHRVFGTESAVLLAMAFDRFVAICRPLHYSSILSPGVIGKIVMACIVRGLLFVFPFITLIHRLPFCGHHVISHTYCDHMGIAKLACANIKINIIYGLTVALSVTGMDVVLIVFSYGFILHTVLHLPSQDAQLKAFRTCGAHVCVILVFYIPAFFSFFTHRFGHWMQPQVHIFMANLYLLVPPVLNPLVYGINTKHIRQRILTLILGNRFKGWVLSDSTTFLACPGAQMPPKHCMPTSDPSDPLVITPNPVVPLGWEEVPVVPDSVRKVT